MKPSNVIRISPPRVGYGHWIGVRAVVLHVACMTASWSGQAGPIRNVILCIGDGMGTGQVQAARCFVGTNLCFESFPYQSLITTFSYGGYVTDSAAAATAMATGHKVNNFVLSLAIPGDARELETLLEAAQKQGKATGLVTTKFLTDATPAAFGAHASSRFNTELIRYDYLNRTKPEILLGGGGGMSVAEAIDAGYTVVTDAASLAALDAGCVPRVCGLFGADSLPYEYDGLGALPSLTDMSLKALDVLDNDPDGFFLMMEGGLIDDTCHGNDLERCVFETLAFDAAVKKLAEWAQGRNDTLILVTADHETGGLTVLADNGTNTFPTVSWSSYQHTLAPVRLYGWGVNAGLVTQAVDNVDVHTIAISKGLMPAVGVGIERLAPEQLARTYWAVSSGDVYRIDHAVTLQPPAWQPCGTVTADSTRVTCVTSNTTEYPQGFFRLLSTHEGGE